MKRLLIGLVLATSLVFSVAADSPSERLRRELDVYTIVRITPQQARETAYSLDLRRDVWAYPEAHAAYEAAVAPARFEQITVATAAIGFSPSLIARTPEHGAAVLSVCRNEAAQIRYRIDGGDPTTTVGSLLEVGDTLYVSGADSITRFKAIRTGATSGQLDCNHSS